MKFTNRAFPVFHLLQGDLELWPLQLKSSPHLAALLPTINRIWRSFSPEFSKEVFFMTKTFISAMEKDVFTWSEDIIKDFNEQNKTTFFSGSATFISKQATYCIHADAERGQYCVFEFYAYQEYLSLRSVLLLDNIASGATSEFFFETDPAIPAIHHRIEVFNVFAQMLATLFFVHNVEAQTKHVVGSNRRIKTADHEKFINETPFNIDILDARWYSIIVRTEPFRVQRFKRNQRYGPGYSQVKEIVIESFWKQGYTIRAKMLNEHEGDSIF